MSSQAALARRGAPARDTNVAQVASSSSPSKIHLTYLLPEILDLIFHFVSEKKPSTVPLCKALLPFQRRQYRKLCLPSSRQPSKWDPYAFDWNHTSLVSMSTSLTSLAVAGGPETPALLLALPSPMLLVSLGLYPNGTLISRSYRPKSLHTVFVIPAAEALASALEVFIALETLEIDCPVKGFCTATMQAALQGLGTLKHLTLGETLRDDLALAPLCELVEPGPNKLPSLKTLAIEMDAEYGCDASSCELNPRKSWHFEDSGWVLPQWGKTFPREDVEELVRRATAAGVEVEESLFEAMAIEDHFNEESPKWDRLVKDCRKADREYDNWRAQEAADDEWDGDEGEGWY
ncbi:hypothetical protein JCM10207_004303 [Rhodosporidiobolus poonsookiae]